MENFYQQCTFVKHCKSSNLCNAVSSLSILQWRLQTVNVVLRLRVKQDIQLHYHSWCFSKRTRETRIYMFYIISRTCAQSNWSLITHVTLICNENSTFIVNNTFFPQCELYIFNNLYNHSWSFSKKTKQELYVIYHVTFATKLNGYCRNYNLLHSVHGKAMSSSRSRDGTQQG